MNLQKLMRTRSHIATGLWVTVLGTVAVTAWFLYAAHSASHATVVQGALNTGMRQQAARHARDRVKPTTKEHLAQWALLHKERRVDWGAMLQVIEDTASKEIELLEFAPDKQSRRIVLRGEAKNNLALLAYLDAVSGHPSMRKVRLIRRELVEWEKLVSVEFHIEGELVSSN